MMDALRNWKMSTLEPQGDLNIFEWNISNFKRAFKNTRECYNWSSPVFVGKSADGPKSFWKIVVFPKGVYENVEGTELEVYLLMKEDLNPDIRSIKAKYKMWFLKTNLQKVNGRPGYGYRNIFKYEEGFAGFGMVTHSELFHRNSGLLEDDVLRIRIKLRILDEIKDAAPEKQNKGQLHKDLSELLESSFSDLTILAEDSIFKVYKGILSCRSPVFAAMFKNDMSESLTSIIKIEDFSSKTVKGMLEFIYSENVESVNEDFMELLKIAEKYELAELKVACIKAAMLKISVENVIELLILGDLYNAPELKSKAMVFINSKKANPMFSPGNQNEALEKLAKEHPMLLLEMFHKARNNDVRVHYSEEFNETIEQVTRFTTSKTNVKN